MSDESTGTGPVTLANNGEPSTAPITSGDDSQSRSLQRRPGLDVILGFAYFWACYAAVGFLLSIVPTEYHGLSVWIAVGLLGIAPLLLSLARRQPQLGWPFGRGMLGGLVSFGMLYFGAFQTCNGYPMFGNSAEAWLRSVASWCR